jgi:hypothetical protein
MTTCFNRLSRDGAVLLLSISSRLSTRLIATGLYAHLAMQVLSRRRWGLADTFAAE